MFHVADSLLILSFFLFLVHLIGEFVHNIHTKAGGTRDCASMHATQVAALLGGILLAGFLFCWEHVLFFSRILFPVGREFFVCTDQLLFGW